MSARRLLLLTIALLVGVASAIATWMVHVQSNAMEHKTVRQTSGTVLYKRHVNFRDDESFYVNAEGQRVPIETWRRKFGEDRVYYRVDNFDEHPGSTVESPVKAEQEREAQFGPRFSVADRQLYDITDPGDKLEVKYRWANDGKIEVIGIDKQK